MPKGVYKRGPRKPMSEETKRKIGRANSVALKGRKLSNEQVEKLRVWMKMNNPMKNKISRERVSRKLTGIVRPKGEKTYNWKGEEAGYGPKHVWLSKYFGKAKMCEKCGVKGRKKYEWANISGKYLRQRSDYMQLCCSCHRKMDITDMARKNMSHAHIGKIPWNRGLRYKIKNRKAVSIQKAEEIKKEAQKL